MQWQPDPKDAALRSLQLPAIGSKLSPQACKELAVLIAGRGIGQVAPNPLVGAVLVDADHGFLGAGAHERLGQAHAEVNALDYAEQHQQHGRIRGGTLYVTLEPCAHSNRTPACATTLASTGLAKVVYGLVDPNPRVDGRGAKILEQAGIRAELDHTWSATCSELAEIFLCNVRQQRPFVALKVALSLDGLIALPGSQRAWITGPRARAYGHFLRIYYDAIVIGRGTGNLGTGIRNVTGGKHSRNIRFGCAWLRNQVAHLIHVQDAFEQSRVRLMTNRNEHAIHRDLSSFVGNGVAKSNARDLFRRLHLTQNLIYRRIPKDFNFGIA